MLGLRIISRRYGSGTQRSNLSEILPSDLYLPILNLGYSFWIYVATSLSLPMTQPNISLSLPCPPRILVFLSPGVHTFEPLYVSDCKYIDPPPSSFENAFPPSLHAHGLHLCYKSNLFALSFLSSQRGCIAIILVLLVLFQEGTVSARSYPLDVCMFSCPLTPAPSP